MYWLEKRQNKIVNSYYIAVQLLPYSLDVSQQNVKSNKIYERALRIIYNDHSSGFKSLLVKNHFFIIYDRKCQYFSVEILKLEMDLSPVIMKNIFQVKENPVQKLTSDNHLPRANIRPVCFGSETVANLEAKI